MRYENYGDFSMGDSGFGYVVTLLVGLCFGIPMMTYKFKMHKRSVDCYYSLPLKREKLYLVKTLVGLLTVAIPFTVCYWVGFFILLVREGNPFAMGWYLPGYFGLLLYGALLYGFNSFAVTRANKLRDGWALVTAYGSLLFFVYLYVAIAAKSIDSIDFGLMLLSPGGLIKFAVNIGQLIVHGSGHWDVWMFLVPIVEGALGYFLLFYLLRFEKAEDAEQISNSWFGYKTVIPVITALTIGMFGGLIRVSEAAGALIISVIVIAAIVSMIAYKRKFRLGGKDWITIGISVLVGAILALIAW